MLFPVPVVCCCKRATSSPRRSTTISWPLVAGQLWLVSTAPPPPPSRPLLRSFTISRPCGCGCAVSRQQQALGWGWRRAVVLNAQHSCVTRRSVVSLITIQATTLLFLLPLLSPPSSLAVLLLLFFLTPFVDSPHFPALPDVTLFPNRSLISDGAAPSSEQIAYRLPQSHIQLAAGCWGHRSMTDPEQHSVTSTN